MSYNYLMIKNISLKGFLLPKATKVALLQSKFHRVTKGYMTRALKVFDLNTIDWILLGFLDHKGTYVSFSEVSDEVGIQDSFLTVVGTKLENRNMITVIANQGDKRKKSMCITKEGKRILNLSQQQFDVFFEPLLKGLDKSDLDNFMLVIRKIIKNHESMSQK